MTNNKSWKDRKRDYFSFMYGDVAEDWKDEKDDRKLFSNTYFMIMEAINSLDDDPNPYVKVAMNRMLEADKSMLDRILNFFR